MLETPAEHVSRFIRVAFPGASLPPARFDWLPYLRFELGGDVLPSSYRLFGDSCSFDLPGRLSRRRRVVEQATSRASVVFERAIPKGHRGFLDAYLWTDDLPVVRLGRLGTTLGLTQRTRAAVAWHDGTMSIAIRPAETRDEAALARIERETWLPHVSPSGYKRRPFFENTRPDEVLVAVLEDQIVGYVSLRPPTPLRSNEHVLMITALAVTAGARRQGVASGLLEAAERYASERNIERLTLRVLSVNTAARALYERRGYQMEGELRGEFRLPVGPGGAVVAVNDVLMAKTITQAQ